MYPRLAVKSLKLGGGFLNPARGGQARQRRLHPSAALRAGEACAQLHPVPEVTEAGCFAALSMTTALTHADQGNERQPSDQRGFWKIRMYSWALLMRKTAG